MTWLIIIVSVVFVIGMISLFKKPITTWLMKLRSKLQIHSLREAINEADKDKATTGRKNMVVFNRHSGKFEPLQKKLLKAVARSGKNKSNKAMTDGRFKMMKPKKTRSFDTQRVKTIEKKSLYVTK